MIARIDDLPEGVVGVTLEGLVTGAEYRETMEPALAAAAASGDMRMLFVIGPDFHMGAGALMEDAKTGVGVMLHQHSLPKRFAIVSDVDWIRQAIHLLGWMSPGDVKVWRGDGRDEAVAWLAS